MLNVFTHDNPIIKSLNIPSQSHLYQDKTNKTNKTNKTTISNVTTVSTSISKEMKKNTFINSNSNNSNNSNNSIRSHEARTKHAYNKAQAGVGAGIGVESNSLLRKISNITLTTT